MREKRDLSLIIKTPPITSFTGNYRFLSNFYPATVMLDGQAYPTVEHAYQAAKTTDKTRRELISSATTASTAKRLGKSLILRDDWNAVKLRTMGDLVEQKFTKYPELAELLLATGDRALIEGNNWGDTFWGECPIGNGANHLGLILMDIRTKIKKEKQGWLKLRASVGWMSVCVLQRSIRSSFSP